MPEARRITNIVVVVDVQRDFFKLIAGHEGSLGVEGADDSYAQQVRDFLANDTRGDTLLLGTQDFHPAGHMSFAESNEQELFTLYAFPDGRKQMMWPVHCVQGTHGVGMPSEAFGEAKLERVFQKGTEMNVDSYGGILSDLDPEGNRIETGMGAYLSSVLNNEVEEFDSNIQVIEIIGLAFDYCVGVTALQIRELVRSLGLNVPVVVFKSLCRSVAPESAEAMEAQLLSNGVAVI